MSKIIGIPGYSGRDSKNFGVGNNYLEFASKFGIPKILMPNDNAYNTNIDVLLIPGGLDINPQSYGEFPSFNTSNTDVFKQNFFNKNLESFIEMEIPIVGICLGAQQLAVYFGAPLVQDLLFHEQSSDRWQIGHKIYRYDSIMIDDSGKIIFPKKGNLEVNSHHHQAILTAAIENTQLEAIYVAPLKGFDKYDSYKKYNKYSFIVEAFKHKTKPIWGIQWHPEELYDSFSVSVMEEAVSMKPSENKIINEESNNVRKAKDLKIKKNSNMDEYIKSTNAFKVSLSTESFNSEPNVKIDSSQESKSEFDL